MIHATELRLNNWVQAPLGEYMQVKQLGHQYNDNYILGVNKEGFGQNNFEGIKLSPSILEKAGFVKDGFGHYGINLPDTLTCITKRLYFAGDYLYLDEGIEVGKKDIITIWNKDVMKEFYLHSLQNVFHSLTGTELSISL